MTAFLPRTIRDLGKVIWCSQILHAMGPFLYPLETLENQRFSDAFRGYRKRLAASNGLMESSTELRYAS